MHRVSLVALFALVGCAADSRTPKVDRNDVYTCPSPGGRHAAIFRLESGGGAAGFAYEYVDILNSSDHQESRVLSLKGGYEVRLRWLDSLRLQIEYPDSARVDHWQSWFGPGVSGRVALAAAPSRGGRLLGVGAGCQAPQAGR